MSLDEKQLRKPGFTEGIPVVLADGQTWHLPKPRMSLKPRIQDGKIKIDKPTFGPEFDPSYDLILGVTEPEGWQLMEAKCTIAWLLLKSNYDLPDDALPELLSFDAGDQTSTEMWRSIMDVVLGRDPKEHGEDT